jgi:hypothetical protein
MWNNNKKNLYTSCSKILRYAYTEFFLEHTGELCIIVLRRKKKGKSPYKHTQTTQNHATNNLTRL